MRIALLFDHIARQGAIIYALAYQSLQSPDFARLLPLHMPMSADTRLSRRYVVDAALRCL